MIYNKGSRIRYAFVGNEELEQIRDSSDPDYNWLKFLLLGQGTIYLNSDGSATADQTIESNAKTWTLE